MKCPKCNCELELSLTAPTEVPNAGLRIDHSKKTAERTTVADSHIGSLHTAEPFLRDDNGVAQYDKPNPAFHDISDKVKQLASNLRKKSTDLEVVGSKAELLSILRGKGVPEEVLKQKGLI